MLLQLALRDSKGFPNSLACREERGLTLEIVCAKESCVMEIAAWGMCGQVGHERFDESSGPGDPIVGSELLPVR